MNSPPVSLVLIPGFMLDETLWDDVSTHLPADWRMSYAALAGGNRIKDIARHIADGSPGRFVLVGFSLGGYIARQLAADYPERVSALVIIASSLREDTEQQAKSKMQAVQALSPSTFTGLSAGAIAGSLHPRRASDAGLIARIKAMGNRLGYGALAVQSGLRRAGVPADSISCPTLVVASTHDALRSAEEARELAAAIPHATLRWLDDSGHMIPLEQPQALAAALVSWLGTQGMH